MIVSVKSIGNIMAVTVLLIFMFGVIGQLRPKFKGVVRNLSGGGISRD